MGGSSKYKKKTNKGWYIQDRLYHKGIYCISNKWFKWAKKLFKQRRKKKNKTRDKNWFRKGMVKWHLTKLLIAGKSIEKSIEEANALINLVEIMVVVIGVKKIG